MKCCARVYTLAITIKTQEDIAFFPIYDTSLVQFFKENLEKCDSSVLIRHTRVT